MTDEQIENWRKVIFQMMEEKSKGAGIYAHVMPKEEIEKFRDKMQEKANKLAVGNFFIAPNGLQLNAVGDLEHETLTLKINLIWNTKLQINKKPPIAI